MPVDLHTPIGALSGVPYGITAPAPAGAADGCLVAASGAGDKIVLLSGYGGRGASTPFNLAGGTHRTHTVAVTGSGAGKVVLAVSGYEPTIWDLSAVQKRVVAVIASGHYPQGISGLPKSVPVRFVSERGREFSAPNGCAWLPWAYRGLGNVTQLAAAARLAIGRHPDRYYGGYNPTSFDIDGGPGAVPVAPRLSDVRTAVPILEDDPEAASGFQPDYGPPEEAQVKVADRAVRWDETGKVVSAVGLDAAPSSYRSAPHPIREVTPARSPSSSAWAWVIAIGGIAILVGRRRASADGGADVDTPAAPDIAFVQTEPTAPAKNKKRFPEDQLRELSALASLTGSEPLVVALHRLGRELIALSAHAFEADLADEINAIVDKHLDHAVARYRLVRATLGSEEAAQADESLRRAAVRLTGRLHELREEQQHRDVSGIDEAARFIDARHPDKTSDLT